MMASRGETRRVNAGSTCVQPGFNLGSTWVQPGFNLGSTWVNLHGLTVLGVSAQNMRRMFKSSALTASRQELTLVHFSAQLEPWLTQ